mmetsp:Transcript_3392/g.13696  ORF Transcript_3392/g.13696 Transcript_3392/m.13696 type:complete len:300 (+) Transcript_3392:419-1318(+)
MTRSRSSCSMPPCRLVHLCPMSSSALCSAVARSRVRQKTIACPSLSHQERMRSRSTVVLSCDVGHCTWYCLITSSDSFSRGSTTWLTGGGTTRWQNFITLSEKVAENSSTCTWPLTRAVAVWMVLNRRIESSAKPSLLSIWSASSNTRILMPDTFSCWKRPGFIQFLSVPGVPITTCASMAGPFSGRASPVVVHFKPVYFPIFSSTRLFCNTSSRVGQTHSACGCATDGSHRESMPRVKQVVLPLPLCACAMRLVLGGWMIMGSVSAWIFDGFSNFISAYSPLSSSALRPSSSKLLAAV